MLTTLCTRLSDKESMQLKTKCQQYTCTNNKAETLFHIVACYCHKTFIFGSLPGQFTGPKGLLWWHLVIEAILQVHLLLYSSRKKAGWDWISPPALLAVKHDSAAGWSASDGRDRRVTTVATLSRHFVILVQWPFALVNCNLYTSHLAEHTGVWLW